jgi:hypothetical protein
VAWAAAESEARLGDRWLHVQGVDREGGLGRLGSTARIVTNLLTAAHLHDLGYSLSLGVIGFHQLDGGACSSTRS